MIKKKESFLDWFAEQLSTNPAFHEQVEATLSTMRLEQDLIALRESRGVSQDAIGASTGNESASYC
jgi:hypothetical protein